MKIVFARGKGKIIIICLFVVGLLVWWPRSLAASTWKGEELLRQWRQAAWRLGPFRIQPMIMLTNIGYDSNVYYYSRENPIEDYTFTAGPAANVYLGIKRKLLFSFYGSPQYVYFFETKRERTWNYYTRAELNLILNRFLITAGAGYSDARERWNTEIDIRPRRLERTAWGEFLWQMTRKLSFSMSGRVTRYDYENLEFERFRISEVLDRTENYGTATFYYQVGARTRFFNSLEYGYFDFANPLSQRDSRSLGYYGGFEFSPFGKIRGRLRLGYKYFDSLEERGEDYRGLVGDTMLELRFWRRLVLRGSYRRNVQFSLWYDNTFYVEDQRGGGLSYYVHRKIRLDYDYFFGLNRYPRPGGEAAGREEENGERVGQAPLFVKRLDKYQIHSVAIYFRLKQNIGLGLVGSHWERDSNLPWEDDRRYFLGLNLTYTF